MANTMFTPNATNKLFFYSGIMDSLDGRKLKAYKPDKDGYYRGVPLSVFNEKSYNGCYYDSNSLHTALSNPKSSFMLRITHGNLYGEWGHPANDSTIERIADIDRTKESHHILNCYTDKEDNSPNPIIRGDIKPSGPYKNCLEESLISPYENTSFSLRCLMTEKMDPSLGAPVRTVVDFITFDAVNMPGYMKASKWYAPAYESFREIQISDLYNVQGARVAMEGYSDNDILELFGVTNINLGNDTLGCYLKGTSTYLDNAGNRRSLTQAILKHSFL